MIYLLSVPFGFLSKEITLYIPTLTEEHKITFSLKNVDLHGRFLFHLFNNIVSWFVLRCTNRDGIPLHHSLVGDIPYRGFGSRGTSTHH